MRKFFERRLKLEMKVRERIFREGRSQSKKGASVRGKQSGKYDIEDVNKISQKKRE